MRLHVGDEVIRILSGELTMPVGDERRTCRDGDVIIVPPNVLHGFRVVADTVVEVVAEHDIGTFYPVRQADGTRRLVEVFTRLPWDAPPPRPGEHTTDEEVQEIVRAVDIEV
jgi:Cupin domain